MAHITITALLAMCLVASATAYCRKGWVSVKNHSGGDECAPLTIAACINLKCVLGLSCLDCQL